VAGRAVGLVLGRRRGAGFAHIGVVKALLEAGVPFDFLGGVSMGAIVAAGPRAEWDIDELTDRMRAHSSPRGRCRTFTLPADRAGAGQESHRPAGARHFQDLVSKSCRSRFFCISSDLTTGHIHEHRSGLIWRALRASSALPGILPPVNNHGHLLVDAA